MASEGENSNKIGDKSKKLTHDQIVATFNRLREEQKNYVYKLSVIEHDLSEHSLVVDTLKEVEPDRVCYRMIGGVLVERTVKEVLPAVSIQKEQLSETVDALNKRIEEKGKEINEYKEKHNIQIRKELPIAASEPSKDEPQTSSVLVTS